MQNRTKNRRITPALRYQVLSGEHPIRRPRLIQTQTNLILGVALLLTVGCAAFRGDGLSVESVLHHSESVAAEIEREPDAFSPVFQPPLKKMRVNSRFGHRHGSLHAGVDLKATEGTPVYAAADGIVVYEDDRISGYGLTLILRHRRGYSTLYAHNSETRVGMGDHVTRGQCIAYSGQSGNASGPHLHFEVRSGLAPLEPLATLNTLARAVKVAPVPPLLRKISPLRKRKRSRNKKSFERPGSLEASFVLVKGV